MIEEGSGGPVEPQQRAVRLWQMITAAGMVVGGLLWVAVVVVAPREATLAFSMTALGIVLLAISLPGAVRADRPRAMRNWLVSVAGTVLVEIGLALYVLFGMSYVLVIAGWLGVGLGETPLVLGMRATQVCIGVGMVALGAAWERSYSTRVLRLALVVFGWASAILALVSVLESPMGTVWFAVLGVMFVWIGVTAWPSGGVAHGHDEAEQRASPTERDR